MRRLASILVVLGAAAAAFALSAPGGGDGGDARRYVIELDNAFGMVLGGDVRVAGVNAGTITDVALDEESLKALIEVEIDEKGFGSLREDTRCETRPQSPLGEYFLDCNPGTSDTEIEDGGRVRVERTTSTIPPDLVQNTMRRPYAERFRLVLNEFGAGLAGRPEDLNEAIRRGVPALRQTSRLLGILAEHNRVIRELVGNADRVIGKLAANRRDVGRFVDEAEDTASASAQRADDIAENFERLPRFVRELRPTMAKLEEVAVEQRPVLVDLSAAAPGLTRFLDNSGRFAEVARPSIRALAEAAPIGREAVRAALPNTRKLRSYAAPTPDLGQNLRMTLEDWANPKRAVERDPRSPRGGSGYSGMEALLAYVFNQSMTINGFDQFGHMVRAAIFVDDCAPYMNGERAKADPALAKECNAWLGPNQPGITTPDPSGQAEPAARHRARKREPDMPPLLERALDTGRSRERNVAPPTRNDVAPQIDLGSPLRGSQVESILDFLLGP